MPEILDHPDVLISEIIPSEEVEKLELGRTEEILQPLMDLGYIKLADPILLPDGIRKFRKDYLVLNLIPEFAPNLLFLPLTELEGEELNLLHTLVALDGDYTLDQLPEIGSVNLCSRLFHYRLSIHQFNSFDVDAPFSQESITALNGIKTWIKNLPTTTLGLINLLGNIPELLLHISNNRNGGLHKKIVAFKYHKATRISTFNVDVPDDVWSEISENEEDEEIDNEISVNTAEIKLEAEIEQINSNVIFNNEEQKALRDEKKKTKRRRSRLLRVSKMIHLVLAKQKALSDDISERSNFIITAVNRLKVVRQELSTLSTPLRSSILEKEKQISKLKQGLHRLDNKERQLKRKIKRKAKKHKIDKLKAEIAKLKAAKIQVEQLQIEKSTLHVKLIPIEEDLKRIDRQITSFDNQMKKLIEERETVMSEKQNELIFLLDRLKTLERKVNKLKYSFRGRMRRVLDKDFYRNEVKKEIFIKRNREKLEAFSNDPYNIYLIRLIQIFQWTNGYYYGKLDNSVGNRTVSALNDMDNYSKNLKIEYILSRLSENHAGTSGYWILNIKYLFNQLSEFLKQQDKSVTTKELLEKYQESFFENDKNRDKIGNEITDKGYQEIVEENKEDIRENGVIRRIYYGIRSIASTLLSAFKQLFQIIKRGVKKLIYLVKNLIKIVYKEIREGVRKFKDGMKFLFGKRQFITPTQDGSAILTKFDFDFDTMTYAPLKVSDQELVQHAGHLYRYSNNLDFTMVLTAKILKWVFRLINATTPIGWARLALRIAIQYKKMIIKWLVRLGRKLHQKIISIKYEVEVSSNPVIID